MSYASSAKTDYVGVNIPTLPPGIYSGEMVGFKLERPKDNQDNWLKRRMVFRFVEDENQGEHVHTEYEIDENDQKAESKATNLVKRVGHMLSKFVAKDKLQQDNDNFSDYGKWVKETLGESYKGKKIRFMVVGNVYDGKATSGFPGYLPFMVLEGESLGFDSNHTRSNAEYAQFMGGGGSAPDTTEPDNNKNKEEKETVTKKPTEEPDF